MKYKGILYFISCVILATLCIQVYWNYKNYHQSRQQLINDVQTSLDNAVDSYYTGLAKNKTMVMLRNNFNFEIRDSLNTWAGSADSALVKSKSNFEFKTLPERFRKFKHLDTDSSSLHITMIDSARGRINDPEVLSLIDSIADPIQTLSSKIFISFREDSLSLNKIDSLVAEELARKKISATYGLVHSGFMNRKDTLRPEQVMGRKTLSTKTSSPYFFSENSLEIYFSNITLTILKRNLIGILLSFLLVLGVVLCLLYLLKIIRQQKQLAEVKNDLISNITHEFKTPIATIGIAMEGIESFKDDTDPEKHLRYARISMEQVDKLNAMVEKLLETAALDSEKLVLDFERCDLVSLLGKIVNSENYLLSGKELSFTSEEEAIEANVDVFHLENALNNILDNAIKYGGDKIQVTIGTIAEGVRITISDNGNSLTSQHARQIFEKFYRVPKGNTHDVKGFGIGLYYSRKIVERHGGSIELDLSEGSSFNVTLPYG